MFNINKKKISLLMLFCMTFMLIQLIKTDKVFGAQTILYPSMDTYVNSGTSYPTGDTSAFPPNVVNWVGIPNNIGNENRSAIQFKLDNIKASQVTSATLKIKVKSINNSTSVAADAALHLYGSNNDDWSDPSKANANVNVSDTSVVTSILQYGNEIDPSKEDKSWIEISVTNFVTQELSKDKTATFVLTYDNPSGKGIAYYSGEDANENVSVTGADSVVVSKDCRPQLVVDYSLDYSGIGIDSVNNKLTGTSSKMEYTFDPVDGASVNWHSCVDGDTSVTFGSPADSYTIYVSDASKHSDYVKISKFVKPNLVYDDFRNTISGLTSDYAYSMDSGTTWKDGSAAVAGDFDGVHNVMIRKKPTSDSLPTDTKISNLAGSTKTINLASDIQTINFTDNGTVDLSSVDIDVANNKILYIPHLSGSTTSSALEYSLDATYGTDGKWTNGIWNGCTSPEVTNVNFDNSTALYVRQIGNISNYKKFTLVKPSTPNLAYDDKENTISGLNGTTASGVGYEYSIDGGSWISGATLPSTSDLSGKKTVRIRVKATKTTPASDIQTIKFTTLPGAPTGVSATAGDRKAIITFTAPDDGGSPILHYTVTANPGKIAVLQNDPTQTTVTVPGLSNGIAYTFTVTATNINGTSVNSELSNTVTPISQDAHLSYLSLNTGTLSPSFSIDTLNYLVNVNNDVTSITVRPTSADSNAKITVNSVSVVSANASDPINLNVGNNVIVIQVTAQSGLDTKIYTVTVNRAESAAANSKLSSLTVESSDKTDGSVLSPNFDPSVLEYVMNVSNAAKSVNVTAVAASTTTSTITINGTPKSTLSVNLVSGNNNVSIVVKALDGTKTTYKVVVTRDGALPNDNNLQNLKVSIGTDNFVKIAPDFSSTSTSYTATVENSISSVVITPYAEDEFATINVNGSEVISGTSSDGISLNAGANTISIDVIAQDGTKKTYKVVITRASAITIKGVTLDIESKTLLVNDTLQLNPTINPSNAQNKNINWYSSNAAIADVDSNGIVTAKSVGTAVITAATEEGGFTANCNIEVKSVPVTPIDNSTITPGASGTIVSVIATTAVDGTASIPGTAMKKLKDANNSLSVTIGDTSIVVPATILSPSNYQGDPSSYSMLISRYTLGESDIEKKLITKTAGYGVVTDPFELVMNIVDSTGKVTPVHNFVGNKPVSVNIQLTDSQLRGRDISKLAVYYWNPTKTQWESQGGSFNTKTKIMTFNTTHFSIFVLMDSAPPVNATGVKINATSKTIKTGSTFQLTATMIPAKASDKNVTWESSNTSIATVDANGLVTAVATGTAAITLTTEDGGYTASCNITVNSTGSGTGGTAAVTGVTLSESSKTIKVGSSATLSATVTPSNAANKDVSWSSSNTAIATVDSNGKVTAITNGYATITVYASGYSASCSITVNSTGTGTSADDRIHVTGITLDKSNIAVNVGETGNIKATITPAKASSQGIMWASSNTLVATVDGAGKVTAVGAGTAIIYATTTEYGYSASCSVTTSIVPVKSIAISGAKTMDRGEKEQLVVKLNPANATNKDVRWESSDESVVAVDEDGNVTAVGPGTATVYATTNDGKYTAKSEIKVPLVKATGIPKVSFVGLSNLPALAGSEQQFYLTSSDCTGDVQYQIFYISTGPDGPDRDDPLNWTKIQDWTDPHDAKSPYIYTVPAMDEGDYAFAIRVKRAGLGKGKTQYSNDAGEYDDAYPFNYNFTSADSVGTSALTIVPSDTQCNVGDTVTFNVLKGGSMYKLYAFNEALSTKWSEVGVVVDNTVKWTPKKSGDYVIDVQVIDSSGNVLGWKLLKISVFK